MATATDLVAGSARLALALALATSAACAPPTDRLVRIAAEETPLLGEGAPDGHASALHAGDLVKPGRTAKPHLAWHGSLDGKPASAEGELVEASRAGAERGYLFRSALGDEVRAASAGYICHRLHAGPDCASRLRRVDAGDGALLAYLPCPTAACPVALLKGRTLSSLTINGLSELRLSTLDGQRVALATAVEVHDPKFTEGRLHVLRLGDHIERGVQILTSIDDVRTVRQHFQEGELTFTPDSIGYRGQQRWVDGRTNEQFSTIPVRQVYHMVRPTEHR